MAKAKITDVAQHAGTSKSTVSQFLSGRFEYMSSKTKARIELAISELNYIPNPIARNLKTNKTKTIGVIVRSITGYDSCRAVRAIDDFCKANGYSVLIYNTDIDPAIEEQALISLRNFRVDGIIIAPSGLNLDLIAQLNKNDLPVVQYQIEHDQRDTSIVVSDYEKYTFEATEYLIELGHKRICFLTQEIKDVTSRRERYQGYAAALLKHNIPLDEDLIQYWDKDSGFLQSPKSILNMQNPPTAFFSQHLAITSDLLQQLHQLKVDIPEQVSVIGFDKVPMANLFKTPITTIEQDPHRIGTESAKLLFDVINKKVENSQKIVIPCTFQKRLSCKDFKNRLAENTYEGTPPRTADFD